MPLDPARLRQIYVTKGELAIWDLCSKCIPHACALVERCHYAKKGYCTVESKYLTVISKPVVAFLKLPDQVLTELEWLDFGLKWIPLHHDLIRVKMAEAALDSILIEGKFGVRMHPLLKAKRDTIKAIDSLDITRVLKDKFNELGLIDEKDAKPSGPSITDILEQDGDPNYIDRLMGEGEGEEESD